MMTLSQNNNNINKAPCFIIHVRPYKERARLVEIFSLEYGRLGAVAYIGKKGFKNRALLQPFVPLNLNLFKNRGNLWNIGEVKVSGDPFNFKLPMLFCAQYLNELLFYLLHEQDSMPQLFASYIKSLEVLSRIDDNFSKDGDEHLRFALRSFEEILLKSLGYAPSFEDTLGKKIIPECRYAFAPSQGFFLCDDPSFPTVLGQSLILISQGHYKGITELNALQIIHSSLIKKLLGNRTLQSQKLYRQYLKDQEI